MSLCYGARSTCAKRLETTQQANFTGRSLSLFDVGDLGSRLETSKTKTLPSSPPGMEKSFSKRAHFCTWLMKIWVKQLSLL